MKKTLSTDDHSYFLGLAIDQAIWGVSRQQGGPFGAVIVLNGEILVKSNNMVLTSNDPTAHAEIVAIREACKKLNNHQLEDCYIYASCEPCPMCLGAVYWARPAGLIFTATRIEASAAGFDDEFIYTELSLPTQDRHIATMHLPLRRASEPFEYWEKYGLKKLY